MIIFARKFWQTIELVAEIANGTEIEVNDILLKVFVTKKA